MQYDVIIVGAGIPGLALANILPKSLKIALIDARQPLIDLNNSDLTNPRVSAINLKSQAIFQQIHVWDTIKKTSSPFRGIQVWDETGKGEVHFHAFEIDEPHLGNIIENNSMQQALLSSLSDVDCYFANSPQKLVVNEKYAELELQNSLKISGQLIIGADGAHSWVRETSNIKLNQNSYQQNALTAIVETENTHQEIARQVFLPDSILAFLPLSAANKSSIVWSCNLQKATKILRLKESEFNEEITRAFNNRLGKVKRLSPLQDFSLTMRHAENYVKHRVALIGDAAHTLHPLAGQGLNLGLLDVMKLNEVINQAYNKHRDIGALDTLRRYERARKDHNALMIKIMEMFKQVFANQNETAIYLRSNALNLTQRLKFIKRFFMRFAAG